MSRVAILLESSHHVSREMILGVLDYVRESPGWDLSLIQGGPSDLGRAVMGGARADAVIVRLSASHMAFGAIRMEPVFFALGQVAGTAAALAIEGGVAVRDVPHAKLRARLLADKQVVQLNP